MKTSFLVLFVICIFVYFLYADTKLDDQEIVIKDYIKCFEEGPYELCDKSISENFKKNFKEKYKYLKFMLETENGFEEFDCDFYWYYVNECTDNPEDILFFNFEYNFVNETDVDLSFYKIVGGNCILDKIYEKLKLVKDDNKFKIEEIKKIRSIKYANSSEYCQLKFKNDENYNLLKKIDLDKYF